MIDCYAGATDTETYFSFRLIGRRKYSAVRNTSPPRNFEPHLTPTISETWFSCSCSDHIRTTTVWVRSFAPMTSKPCFYKRWFWAGWMTAAFTARSKECNSFKHENMLSWAPAYHQSDRSYRFYYLQWRKVWQQNDNTTCDIVFKFTYLPVPEELEPMSRKRLSPAFIFAVCQMNLAKNG